MPLTQVSPGDRILSTDINQYYNILKGVAASGEAVTLIYNGTALIFQPSSDPSAGTRVLDIKNAAGTHLASLDFNGVLELLAAAAAPGGAVAGALYWDTLLAALRVYDGTNWQTLGQTAQPNLVLNSDFGRRTVFGLAMPEVFADTNGYLDSNAGTVSANVLTFNATQQQLQWPKAGGNLWRDARFSVTFKAVSTTGIYYLMHWIDATHYIQIRQNNGNLELVDNIGGGEAVRVTVAQALTLNNWYWLELEVQAIGRTNGTVIGKLYNTGGTVTGVLKSASTLLQTNTSQHADFSSSTLDAASSVIIKSDQSTAQWGGIATGNGGVYVETWLPESWAITFGGTLGGQAIGYDEAADSGPGSVAGTPYKQWAVRGYIPAASRQITLTQDTPDGSVAASTTYTSSRFHKTSGKGGSGNLIRSYVDYMSSALASQGTMAVLADAAETSWTRSSGSGASPAGTRRLRQNIQFNDGSTATGTAWVDLLQDEQGSAATAWRASEKDASGRTTLLTNTSGDKTTTSASYAEIDSRDTAVNHFSPQDETLEIKVMGEWINSAVGNANFLAIYVDGAAVSATNTTRMSAPGNSYSVPLYAMAVTRVAAGKHRIAVQWNTGAGTATVRASSTVALILAVTATAGK